VKTGQNTAEEAAGGLSLRNALPWLVALLVVGFVLYRMRRTGQRLNVRSVANRQVLGGLLLLAVMAAIAYWAVKNLRRPGAMTPIEAQSMEMSTPRLQERLR
jgi:hypothetical protein